MIRKLLLAAAAVGLLVPGAAGAGIDPANCPNAANATSVIAGKVQDAESVNVPNGGIKVEIFAVNSQLSQGLADVTGGSYRICAQHNTWDVHVQDRRLFPRYADVTRPYTTFTNIQDLDFTPASGYPLFFRQNLTISPQAITTVGGPVTMTWTVRTKMPLPTDAPANPTRVVKLELSHGTGTVDMVPGPKEFGGPESGGWNLWTYQETFAGIIADNKYWSTATGFEDGTLVAQLDRQPYYFDKTPPALGPQTGAFCGNNQTADEFLPKQPTTNPQPTVTIGVCDPGVMDAAQDSTASGLDPYSVSGKICPANVVDGSCTSITPVLTSQTLTWFPASPLAQGDYYFQFKVFDRAGNSVQNPTLFKLDITSVGGNKPFFTPILPSNLGSGTGGVVIGCQCTQASSIPQVSFKVTDTDGAFDISPGSLRVRIYFGDERTKLYDYDPVQPENAVNGGEFKVTNARDWNFIAKGFSLQGRQPGRYIVSASVTDHGGNSAVYTWHFLLVAAV